MTLENEWQIFDINGENVFKYKQEGLKKAIWTNLEKNVMFFVESDLMVYNMHKQKIVTVRKFPE